MKYAPDELKALSTNEAKDEGASKEKENVFHKKLDKLVHKTFGHSSDEKKKMKEEAVMVCKDCGDEFGKPTTDCPYDSHDPQGENWVKKVEEASSPAQQAAIAISMKKAGKKPKEEGVMIPGKMRSTGARMVKKIMAEKKDMKKEATGKEKPVKSGEKLSGKQEVIVVNPEVDEKK
jgi:hypothetical protein